MINNSNNFTKTGLKNITEKEHKITTNIYDVYNQCLPLPDKPERTIARRRSSVKFERDYTYMRMEDNRYETSNTIVEKKQLYNQNLRLNEGIINDENEDFVTTNNYGITITKVNSPKSSLRMTWV